MPLVGMPSLTRLVISNSEYIQCVLSSVTARGSPIRALVLSLSSERVNLWEVRAVRAAREGGNVPAEGLPEHVVALGQLVGPLRAGQRGGEPLVVRRQHRDGRVQCVCSCWTCTPGC